jgi:phosphoglycerate dehydrogenase-like enzyme
LISVSAADEGLAEHLARTPGLRVHRWAVDCGPPTEEIDIVVLPHRAGTDHLQWLRGVRTRLVQSPAIGFDALLAACPPGHLIANARDVHEDSTAEMALALMLQAQRGLRDHDASQRQRTWAPRYHPGLWGKRVLLLGYGGVGRAIAKRLAPFGVDLIVAAQRERVEDGIRVHGMDAIAGTLADIHVLVIALPLTPHTNGLVSANWLARLPQDALIVNVGRGQVIDTNALAEAVRNGRLRASVDVITPEPLPSESDLWSLDGCTITPHVGGLTDAMMPKLLQLVREQARRLSAGEEPANVVGLT